MRFFLGGYTADLDGAATGIGVVRAGAADDVLAGGQLSVGAEVVAAGGSPSWLAWHPTLDVMYAAREGAGTVQAFRRTGEETFAAFGESVPAGELVCHVAVSPDGRRLVASCWGDGRVVRMSVGADGSLSRPVPAAAAEEDHADEGMDLPLFGAALAFGDAAPAGRVSHPHQARFLPSGVVATTDMGLDLVRFWREADGGLHEIGRVRLPRGSGPRHTAWHPSGHLYVVTELSHEVFALAPDPSNAGSWRIVGGTPLSPATVSGSDFAAEIALSRDGEYLYAGIRGSNTLATVRVRGSGADFTPVALTESGVDWPRHHVVARDTLLVAGQRSHEVASLTLDGRTGVPGRVRHRVETPSPSHLLPDRA